MPNTKTVMPKTAWTQSDILSEAEARHCGAGFFMVLADVTNEAFGGVLECDAAPWQFRMGKMSVDDVLRFFSEAQCPPQVEWHKSRSGLPEAFVCVRDQYLAEQFRECFEVPWLTRRELKEAYQW
jgi:hypothetical protein